MRTIHPTSESFAASAASETGQPRFQTIRRLATCAVRFVYGIGSKRRQRNRLCDLSDAQLRDIGLEDARQLNEAISDRATRQDRLLREGRDRAMMLAVGLQGR